MALLFSGAAKAYPQFIGHGYNSCLTCHYNPYGAGALNDYGRALSATKISARWFQPVNKTEEELAENSGFLYRKPDTSWLRTALKYRGLALVKSYDTPTSETEFIHMLARAQVTLKFGERDQFIVSGNLDYAPDPRGGQTQEEDNYRSREHFIGWRPLPSVGLYVGLMDKAFGIRIPDHIAFSRTLNNVTMNDQSHGALLHWLWGPLEVGVHGFVGNLSQDEDLRQAGFSTIVEYLLDPKLKIGASFLSSSSNFTSQKSMAIHQRWGFGEGSSLLLELGQRDQTVEITQNQTTARYLFAQGHLLVTRGVSLLQTVEYLKRNIDLETSVLRLGPGVQIYLNQGIELRFDFYNTRIFSDQNVSDDVWDLTGQVHLWF